MGFDQYHELANEPSPIRTFARMMASLTEEAEAIGWYEQRLAVEPNVQARAIMANAQGEEFKYENRKEEQMTQAHEHLPAPPAPSGPIRLVVDLNRCQAYAQCCFFAPGVFTLHREEALWYDPAPDEAQREHVLQAAAACPVQAIFVEWSEAANRKKAEKPHE